MSRFCYVTGGQKFKFYAELVPELSPLDTVCTGLFAWKPSMVRVTAPACTSYGGLISGCERLGSETRLTARERSSIKSSTSSIPMQRRMISSGICRSFRVFGSILAWLIRHGILIRLLTQPKLTLMPNSFAASTILSDKPISPVSNDKTAPAPRAIDQ